MRARHKPITEAFEKRVKRRMALRLPLVVTGYAADGGAGPSPPGRRRSPRAEASSSSRTPWGRASVSMRRIVEAKGVELIAPHR
jgi:hypothetical protein